MEIVCLPHERGDTASCVTYFETLGVPRTARLLDIGCRHGSFLENLRRRGYEDIAGLDVDAAAITEGEAAYPALKGRLTAYDGDRLPFEAGTFDVITMFDVIEHIKDIDGYMAKVKTLLRPGGLLVFQTPNIVIDVPYWIIALRLFTREKLRWMFTEHCSLQTYGSLRRLLRRAGFAEIIIERNSLDTAFKRDHVRQTLGWTGLVILRVSNYFPMPLYPNFWGHARVR
ncbi:class I SAM-dependent methyltransferase [Ancylobacter sp. SL191]|uniref:class I SAM-dependent methyltransferase n=1 Tax=Ancylobacter sp. SL191 TaxID=2995166 RepID=UPI0022717FBD|nr:class I SAM-dependent methyltransferase [Ancylobacter sp. SL191]WAC27641.1 class I SAM-dependent methyltransferase [Ancylobacter sp. SL191]